MITSTTYTELVDFFNLIVPQALIEIRVVHPSAAGTNNALVARDWFNTPENAAAFAQGTHFESEHVYFGACPRKTRSGTKDAVRNAWVVWADVDLPQLPDKTWALPPSCVVFTGHGYHVYWRLKRAYTEVDFVEQANKGIALLCDGDKVADISRLLRVPGTFNVKDDTPIACEITYFDPTVQYDLSDLCAVMAVNPVIWSLIRTADLGKYATRSERDWRIITALVKAGFSDDAIKLIFDRNPIADKSTEDNGHYLEHSLTKARKEITAPGASGEADYGIFERKGEGYYRQTAAGGEARLTTFTLHPTAVLVSDTGEEILQVDLSFNNTTQKNVLIPRAAFLSVSSLTKHLGSLEATVLGTDRDVRYLLAYLGIKLQHMQRQSYVTAVGRHDDYWVGTDIVFDKDDQWDAHAGPLIFAPASSVFNETLYIFEDTSVYNAKLRKLLVNLLHLNKPEVLYPVLGWYMATPYKPVLQKLHVSFPILNIYGTRGAGKTTIVREVFLPLMGIQNAQIHDCNTTQFVLLTLMGSSNAVPVALAEFRESSLSTARYNGILRTVLLSYDTGRDSRGRADQSIAEYPLTAPMSIDGEDPLGDQAAKERVVAVYMTPTNIAPGSTSAQALTALMQQDLNFFAAEYLRWTLTQDVTALLVKATDCVALAFPVHLPHRVRRNAIVAFLGLLSLESFLKERGMSDLWVAPNASIFKSSLENVVNLQGHSQMSADSFVEDVINHFALTGGADFPAKLHCDTQRLNFHLKTAFQWWETRFRGSSGPPLSYQAIRHQMQERFFDESAESTARGDYVAKTNTIIRYSGHVYNMYQLDLLQCRSFGLEIPEELRKGDWDEIL